MEWLCELMIYMSLKFKILPTPMHLILLIYSPLVFYSIPFSSVIPFPSSFTLSYISSLHSLLMNLAFEITELTFFVANFAFGGLPGNSEW